MKLITIYHRAKDLTFTQLCDVAAKLDCDFATLGDEGLNVYARTQPMRTAKLAAYALGLDVTEIAGSARGVRLDDVLSNVSSARGAPMGRGNDDGLADYTGPLHLQKVTMHDGGYDAGGAYWGGHSTGAILYCAFTATGDVMHFVRAANRKEALALVRIEAPAAKIRG